MDLSRLSEIMRSQPAYRYRQINRALYQDYVSSWDEVSSLPKELRQALSEACPLDIQAELRPLSRGGGKALIYFKDGVSVETVLIKQKDKDGDRYTACLSSQAGCPLACTFCATGQGGFQRNLKAEEIVEQAVFWQRQLKPKGKKLDNIVFMGMGEPFLNYAEFIKAAKFLNNQETMNIGARRLSVSTIGLTEGIKRLAGEPLQMNLAISLHAADEGTRSRLMPATKGKQISELLRTVDQYIKKTGRQVMFEYLLIKGINDRDEDAEALAELMHRPLYFLNLIPYNPTPGRFKPASPERIAAFQSLLQAEGVKATVRLSFGSEIGAACGQLAGKAAKKK